MRCAAAGVSLKRLTFSRRQGLTADARIQNQWSPRLFRGPLIPSHRRGHLWERMPAQRRRRRRRRRPAPYARPAGCHKFQAGRILFIFKTEPPESVLLVEQHDGEHHGVFLFELYTLERIPSTAPPVDGAQWRLVDFPNANDCFATSCAARCLRAARNARQPPSSQARSVLFEKY